MPTFVDPKTGEVFDSVPEDEVEKARGRYGLVTPEEYAKENRPLGETIERGVKAWGAGLGRGLHTISKPFEDAGILEPMPPEFYEKAYGAEAKELREESPIISGVAEGAPIIAAGAGLGGAGVGLRGAAAALVPEAAASGISQEAIDATMEKRDFSAKSALWNGVLDLTFGALGYGAGKVLSFPGASAADEAVEGLPGKRNFIAEIDKGAVPEALGKHPARSVGAASGATGDTMSRSDVARYIRDEDEVIDNLQTIAGGGPGERGAFQTFNDSFRDSMSNRIKREDFAAAEAQLSPETLQTLKLETDPIAEELETVAAALEARGAKKPAALLRTHIAQLGKEGESITGVLDRTKQTLDALHVKAVTDATDPYGEVVSAVDPVVNRIRGVLEDAKYVGKQIAEQQAVRNAAWSDKATGFIRNMQRANKVGPSLFKQVDVDYNTGGLVMEFDPSGFKRLLSLDPHEAKPVLEAWGNILDSAEKMALNTAEVGAKSAGNAPLMPLQQSINDIRTIFQERSNLYAAKDIGRKGIEALGRVEALPIVGNVAKGARAVMGGKNLEAMAGAAGQGFVPTKVRSLEEAKAALARRRGQLGAVIIEATAKLGPKGDALLQRLRGAVGKAEARGARRAELEAGARSARERADAIDVSGDGADEVMAAADGAQEQLDNFGAHDDAIGGVLDRIEAGFEDRLYRLRESAKPGSARRAEELQSQLDRIREVRRKHTEQVAVGDREIGLENYLASAKELLGAAEEGAVRTGPGVADILKSPMGVTSAVGLGALGAGRALLPEQEKARSDFEQSLSALPPDQAQMQIAMAETLARVGAQTESRVRNAIGELFSGKPRSMSPRTRAIEKRAQELDVTRAVVRFMGPKEDDPIQAWKDKSALLKDVMSDPSRLARAMAENLGDMPRLQPEMFMKMVANTMATVEYLAMHAPQAAGKSVFDTEGYPPSLEEINSWAGRWVGALHPLDTIDDLASNDVLPEQTEAVKALHPDAFALFQKTALGEISRIRKSRKRIPMQQLEQIDTALDLNGAGEPTLSWNMVRLIQTGEQQAAQTGHQPPSASPMQSKGAERVASSALGSIRPEAGAA